MDLSYDKLIEICESLDSGSLASFARTSKDIYWTCQSILEERYARYRPAIEYLSKLDPNTIEVSLTEYNLDTLKYLNLGRFKNLTRLNCDYNQLINLEGIENCTNLLLINCFNNNLTSLKGIENCTNLEILNCYTNELKNLNYLYNSISLETLNVSDNELTDLKGIENCINLTDLYCENNLLTSLKGIENCTNLRKLYCGDNPLKSLDYIPPSVTYVNT